MKRFLSVPAQSGARGCVRCFLALLCAPVSYITLAEATRPPRRIEAASCGRPFWIEAIVLAAAGINNLHPRQPTPSTQLCSRQRMASVAPTTDDEQTWYAACHRFFATGDADARRSWNSSKLEDSATRDRSAAQGRGASPEAHAELQAQRAADFAARVDALPAGRAADGLVRRALARERLSAASGRWRSAPGKSRVLGGLTSLLRAQRSSEGRTRVAVGRG